MSDKSQYAAAANIPLIQSPSLRAPRPVGLPQDIHPLPESVTQYFVYPFTLEPHIITLESSRRATIAMHTTRREAYICHRADDIERRKRDALHKIAPGLGTLLVPTRASGSPSHENAITTTGTEQHQTQEKERDVMNALVDQLAAIESKAGGGGSS